MIITKKKENSTKPTKLYKQVILEKWHSREELTSLSIMRRKENAISAFFRVKTSSDSSSESQQYTSDSFVFLQ